MLFPEFRALEQIHSCLHLDFDGWVSVTLNECLCTFFCPHNIRAKDTGCRCQTRVAQAGSLAEPMKLGVTSGGQVLGAVHEEV